MIDETGRSFYTGCYVHGGVCGIMKTAKNLPNTTAYLVKAAKEITGEEEFGWVAIVENVSMEAHRDSHNHRPFVQHHHGADRLRGRPGVD